MQISQRSIIFLISTVLFSLSISACDPDPSGDNKQSGTTVSESTNTADSPTTHTEKNKGSGDRSTDKIKKKKGLPEVSVKLFGAPDDVTVNSKYDPSRFEWISYRDNALLRRVSPRKQHIIIIELPSGIKISQFSKMSFIQFNKYRNIFSYVKITPFKEAKEFSEALKKTKEILEKSNWEPDERTKKEMKEWERLGGGRVLSGYKGRGKISGEEKVEVSFHIEHNDLSEKWYLSMIIAPLNRIIYGEKSKDDDKSDD